MEGVKYCLDVLIVLCLCGTINDHIVQVYQGVLPYGFESTSLIYIKNVEGALVILNFRITHLKNPYFIQMAFLGIPLPSPGYGCSQL